MLILVTTLIVGTALAVALLALFRPGTWQPRVTPGIAADLTIVLGDDGQVSIYNSKLAPEQHPGQIAAVMLHRWLEVLGALNVSLDYTTPSGLVVPLCRPEHAETPPEVTI